MMQIEKVARLMGHAHPIVYFDENEKPYVAYAKRQYFDPLRNKADLMDVECALGIDVDWVDGTVYAEKVYYISQNVTNSYEADEEIADHPDAFTARAIAVCKVAEMIYDLSLPT